MKATIEIEIDQVDMEARKTLRDLEKNLDSKKDIEVIDIVESEPLFDDFYSDNPYWGKNIEV